MLPREIIWRRHLDDLSFEHLIVSPGAEGSELSGTVLVAEQGTPLRLEYRILVDRRWATRRVHIAQTFRGRRVDMILEHDGAGCWRIDGQERAGLAGCTDVDLGLSPSTNALPINRLALRQGDSAIIRAAWLRFPDVEPVAADQSYQRLGERLYHYRSVESGFEAELEVDAMGFPTEYKGIWRRLAEGQGIAGGLG